MIKFEEAKNLISKDDFISYFRLHSNIDTANHFDITTTSVVKLCEFFEFKKSKEDIAKTKELTSLERYGVSNPAKCFKNIGKLSDAEKERRQSKKEETMIAKAKSLGLTLDEYKSQIATKSYATKVDKFGSKEAYDEHINKSIEDNLIDRFGSLEKARESQRVSREQTMLEKYGSVNAFSCEEIKNKIKSNNILKYNNACPLADENIRTKANITLSKKYGSVTNARRAASYKAKKTKFDLYGDEHYVNTEKRIATCLEKYGVECSLQNASIRSKQAKSAKESSLEKRLKEFLKNNSIEFEEHFVIKKNDLLHEFDVAIFKNNDLEMLIDCDGLYYHGYLSDVNGKTVNSYSDEYRQSLVPEKVKYFILLEHNEEEAYEEILRLIDIDYNTYVKEVFDWCREVEFPYPDYSDIDIKNSYESLVKSDVNKFNMRARFGERAILGVHRSIWHSNKQNSLSPYEAWRDDNILSKLIKNRIIYKGCNLDRSKVLYGLSASRIAPKVSVFNPYLAKYLIQKYLDEYDVIFDPCSGFSGRMLGTCSLGKYYIGQDINQEVVNESNNLIDKLNLNAKIECKDSLVTVGTYDCLFTCSPYSLKEIWSSDLENKSCDEWVDTFIKNYKCKKYLFVVDETIKYKDYIVEELENKSHFGNNKEYVILIENTSK